MGDSDGFYSLAVVLNDSVPTHSQIFMRTRVFISFHFSWDVYTGVEMLDHMVSVFNCFRGRQTVFQNGHVTLHAPGMCESFCLSISATVFIVCFFEKSRAIRCEVVSLCPLDVCFPDS